MFATALLSKLLNTKNDKSSQLHSGEIITFGLRVLNLLNFNELLLALNMEQFAEFRYVQNVLPKNDLELLLLNTIRDEPLHIDDIKSITGLSTDKVSASLIMMELLN